MIERAKTIPPAIAGQVGHMLDRLLDKAEGDQPFLTIHTRQEVDRILKESGRPSRVRTLFKAVDLLMDIEQSILRRSWFGRANLPTSPPG